MMVNKELCKVIADLEYLVGSECYNPNSYDGWNDIEGCDFRYPVNVPNEKGEFSKIRGYVRNSQIFENDNINEILDSVMYMKYKFGSNELFIGKGIIKILDYLEERYGLNFLELEEKIDNEKS